LGDVSIEDIDRSPFALWWNIVPCPFLVLNGLSSTAVAGYIEITSIGCSGGLSTSGSSNTSGKLVEILVVVFGYSNASW
jgi:hypothetical protein